MVAPAGAALTASLMVRKCVVSSCPSAYDALTNNVHAAAGRTASQPQPVADFTNPGAHAVTPTGAHVVVPIAARVPGAQGSVGRIGVQPAAPSSGVKPSPQSASGAAASGASAAGAAS